MQPNTITLLVNDDNDDGTTAEVSNLFTRFDEYQNRSVYIHSGHTLALRDTLGFYRTFPKPVGNFNGVAKSAVKFTKDFAVAGKDATTTIIAPAIFELSWSLPVGITPAQNLELNMRGDALIVDFATIVAALNGQLVV